MSLPVVERSLADAATSVDVSPAVTPATFNFDDWVAGVRPTRRKIKLFPQAHLVARLDELAEAIDATPEGEDVDPLIDEFEAVRKQFRDGVWFTVEKRSSESVLANRKALAKRLGIKLDEDGDAANTDDSIVLVLHQLANQIVEPAGVTYEHLRAMLTANEGEVNKLVRTLEDVQYKLAENAFVVDRDFSERRSR